ncbi:hypothetical protein ThidrDRAFT_2293 [Thiorhodococcus drewsii AZ1]|uniref:LysM domain-containing protein n=1 Tax=Thiorhodococcus drewsii AZ1 TaxID=765913 RepID=G2E1Y0_9GAMM|nr:hypothetical protein [Thiorhodococcus drewsii]EGV31188.1 hypothetical protein ThidrDRAFT_2293 [Thiorhodococcus drewsii AZ1]
MMTANLLKHRIEPDESLAAIARHHHLPGWQALYFWEGNRDFRTQCPDPWHPDANAVLTIPEIPFHAGALRDTLRKCPSTVSRFHRSRYAWSIMK